MTISTIKPLTVDSDERAAWNQFVAGSPYGHILQSWEWGELKGRTGWKPRRLVLRQGDDISGVAQILLRDLPYGLGRMAYVPRGPVLDWQDAGARTQMMAALAEIAREERVISLKIEPELLDGPIAGDLVGLGLIPAPPVQMRSTIWVDLSRDEDEILARQKQKTRYNIRLAARRGVTVAEADEADLPAWYQMFAVTARRDAFSIHALDYYRLVLEILQPKGMARLLLAHHEGDLLAGIIVFRFGRTAQYMYGASSNEKRNLMAPYLVQWEGMRWAKAGGATTYDLWGIPDRLEENEELWGVYRHKRGYGGEIVRHVGAFDIIRSSVRHTVLERIARPLFKRVARLGA